eukprot:gene10126-biopygen6259
MCMDLVTCPLRCGEVVGGREVGCIPSGNNAKLVHVRLPSASSPIHLICVQGACTRTAQARSLSSSTEQYCSTVQCRCSEKTNELDRASRVFNKSSWQVAAPKPHKRLPTGSGSGAAREAAEPGTTARMKGGPSPCPGTSCVASSMPNPSRDRAAASAWG